MAIKFSELRVLLKDTNIQTVKMSDPVYYTMMTYIHTNRNTPYVGYNNIKFSKLHDWKTNNELYRIEKYYPLSYHIMLYFQSYQQTYNVSLSYGKDILVNYFNEVRREYSGTLYNLNGGLDIFSCYETKDSNTVYQNIPLVSTVCTHQNPKSIINVPIMVYMGNKLTNIPYYKQVKENDYYLVNYYNNVIFQKNDNVNGGIELLTGNFSFEGDGTLRFYYAYKPNDKINKTYRVVHIQHTIEDYKVSTTSNVRLDIKKGNNLFGTHAVSRSYIDTSLRW